MLFIVILLTYQLVLICFFIEFFMKCLNNINIEKFSYSMSTLSQINRLQIVCFLSKNGEKCVCKICEELSIKQNLASHHLNLLKNIWLIKARREGKNIYYSIDEVFYEELKGNIQCIFNF